MICCGRRAIPMALRPPLSIKRAGATENLCIIARARPAEVSEPLITSSPFAIWVGCMQETGGGRPGKECSLPHKTWMDHKQLQRHYITINFSVRAYPYILVVAAAAARLCWSPLALVYGDFSFSR
ncbi:hypothetical protein THAOC_29609 [Thalassiosira oceanica]|uniref:Uncharacterized protein n=1 Tax=Thalassiosira oceanica TaxID=159749 RepID=K0RX10_THAOC|nr:hypothetical protein THAOC_29609 [Thalassiosira oceanica]|eukprot:EJK51237.1 hypothetical protein THAOC_29609 [Thalassiosira oceanica]